VSLCTARKRDFFLEAKMKKKHQVVVVPDGVREGAGVGRWRLHLAATASPWCWEMGFPLLFECS
jgi:hypothetical protein